MVAKTMDDEIDLRDVFRMLWKNRSLAAGTIIISIVIAILASLLMPQIYQVSGIIYLGNFSDSVYANADSAKALMISDGFLSEAIEKLSFEVPSDKYNLFKSGIEIDAAKDAENLLVITCNSPNGTEGKEIVETMISIFAARSIVSYNSERQIPLDQMARIKADIISVENSINQTREVLNNLQDAHVTDTISRIETELRISRTLEFLQAEEAWHSSLMDRYDSLEIRLDQLVPMRVVQEPRLPAAPMQTKMALNVIMATVFGLILGIFAAFLREGIRGLVL